MCKCIRLTLLYLPSGYYFLLKEAFHFFRWPQIKKQMLVPVASFWLLLWKPKLVICVVDHNPYCQLDHPSHAEALIPAYYSAFWDHLFALTVRSNGSFWWRVWKTTSRLQDAASKCDASFIPTLKDMNSCSVAVYMRWVSWERDISVNWLSQGCLSSFIRYSQQNDMCFGNFCRDDPGSFMEPRVDSTKPSSPYLLV